MTSSAPAPAMTTPSRIVNLCRTVNAPIFRITLTIDIRTLGQGRLDAVEPQPDDHGREFTTFL